jgi:ubiquitin carboxyl-terminal hydrolase 7
MLFHINKFRRAVYDLPFEGEDLNTSTTLNLQLLFKNLQTSKREVSTKELTHSFGWNSHEAFMQQDVQEMMRVLLDKLEETMKKVNAAAAASTGSISANDTTTGTTIPTPVTSNLISELFCGKVRSYIRCKNVSYESKREEDFYDIQLDVKGCRTIQDSFRKYVEVETLDGDNQYDAGTQYGKQDAAKGVIFTKFPPILTIHLKRFDFDFETMGFKKIHDCFEFSTLLDVDTFLADDASEESRAVPNRYLLHSVLVHSGDVGGGHYYAYIRPGTKENNVKIYAKVCNV